MAIGPKSVALRREAVKISSSPIGWLDPLGGRSSVRRGGRMNNGFASGGAHEQVETFCFSDRQGDGWSGALMVVKARRRPAMSLTRSLNTLVVCAAFLFVVAIVAGVI
jgi:hypothetical protein